MSIHKPAQVIYTPLQPAFGQKELAVHYHEVRPHELLRHYIWCYWELKTTKALPEDYRYNVVADGCMDIFFSPADIADATIAGFNETHTSFMLGRQFRYAGVRFLPGMFTRLSGLAAYELSGNTFLLADVLPALAARLQSDLNTNADFATISAVFNGYFLAQAQKPARPYDARFAGALNQLMTRPQETELERGLQTGLSARQLRRLFYFYVGGSPRVFGNVVRFQHLLSAYAANPGAFKDRAWLDAGYFDQAHFIKDFKRFGGITPGTLG